MLNPADETFVSHLATMLPEGSLRLPDAGHLEEPRGRWQGMGGVLALPRNTAEVARIVRHRHLPAPIYKAAKLRRVRQDSERRKTQHRVAHSAPGAVQLKPARKKKVVAEVE